MGVGIFVKRIFSTDEPNAQNKILASWLGWLTKKEKEEKKAAQRLIDWKRRDRAAVIEYLKKAASKTFDSTGDWQWPVINGVNRTIRRLAMSYRQPPVRELVRDDKTLEKDSTEWALVREMYRQVGCIGKIEPKMADPNLENVNTVMKEIERWAVLLNTIHVEIVPRGKAIDWDIKLRPSTTVIEHPDNPLDFIKIAFEFSAMNPGPPYFDPKRALLPVKGWMYWTEEQYIFVREDGAEFGVLTDDGSNPYDGKIPVVIARKVETEDDDYWGRFGADLVDSFEQANLQLGNLNEIIFFQAHGQPLGINLGAEKQGGKIPIGPKNPWFVDRVKKDDVTPSLEFPKPDADIEEVQNYIDWLVKMVASTYGLPPSAWQLEEKRLSGFAKFLDNIELIENRDDEAPMWARVEQELFENSRMVYNRWAADMGNKQIPEDISLRITFGDVSFPQNPVEEFDVLLRKQKLGVWSPVEYYMEKEGLTEDAALERAKKVAAWNTEIRSGGGRLALPQKVFTGSEQ